MARMGRTQRRADQLLAAVSGREDSRVMKRLNKVVGVISRPNERAKD